MPDEPQVEVEASKSGVTFTLSPNMLRYLFYAVVATPAVTGVNVETVQRWLHPPPAEAAVATAEEAKEAAKDNTNKLLAATNKALEALQERSDSSAAELRREAQLARDALTKLTERFAVLDFKVSQFHGDRPEDGVDPAYALDALVEIAPELAPVDVEDAAMRGYEGERDAAEEEGDSGSAVVRSPPKPKKADSPVQISLEEF